MQDDDRTLILVAGIARLGKPTKILFSILFLIDIVVAFLVYWNFGILCRDDSQYNTIVTIAFLSIPTAILGIFWFALLFPQIIDAFLTIRDPNSPNKTVFLMALIVIFVLGGITKAHQTAQEESRHCGVKARHVNAD